jgi:hypothetical protein
VVKQVIYFGTEGVVVISSIKYVLFVSMVV